MQMARHTPHSTLAYLLACGVLLSGCGYGYAGQEGNRRSQREYKQSTRVITVREQPPEPVKPEPEPEPEPESPCGTPTFDIFFYQASNQVKKTVDCERRAVVDTQQTPLAQASYASAREAGLPESTWYLLVDPKGQADGVLTNAQLLKLSREFAIEYYGKESSRDLLVYLYQQDDVR